MTFNLNIPNVSDSEFSIQLEIGQILFVLGANGSGKSNLMLKLNGQFSNNSIRIIAHRQSWFEGLTLSLNSAQRQSYVSGILGLHADPDSRWRDHYSRHRPDITIFDLINIDNFRSRSITRAMESDDEATAKEIMKNPSSISVINRLFRESNLEIEISIGKNDAVYATKNRGASYNIAELSDGERNALLIAADVLNADSGTIFLIDEPERHLHRSIISPLLSSLFSHRNDCSFVVSTHDIELPIHNPKSLTLLLRECVYKTSTDIRWNVDYLGEINNIDEDIKRDILGSRKIILFVEGEEASLDKPLYSALFPKISVISKRSCGDVIQSVVAMRSADNHHWVDVFGIVDNDGRTEPDIENLRNKGVFCVGVHSVESIYYHPEMQRRIAEKYGELTGKSAAQAIAEAEGAAFRSLNGHGARLSRRAVHSAIRYDLMKKLPNAKDLENPVKLTFDIDIPDLVLEEEKNFDKLYNAKNLVGLAERYPIRETPALDNIARALGFKGRAEYERSVVKMIGVDDKASAFARNLFGNLPAILKS